MENPEIKKKKKKKKKAKTAPTKGNHCGCKRHLIFKKFVHAEEGQENGETEVRDSSAEKAKKGEGKKKGPTCHMNEELEQFMRRLEESNKNLKEHQKIQPIIADNWIVKVKERYSKLKIKLNK